MQLNLDLNCVIDIPNASFTAKVLSAKNSNGDDISRKFFDYCLTKNLPLDTEANITVAAVEYSKSYAD